MTSKTDFERNKKSFLMKNSHIVTVGFFTVMVGSRNPLTFSMWHLISPEVLVDPAVHSLLGKFTIVKTFNNFFCLSWLTLSSVVVSIVPFEKQLLTKLFLHNLNSHLIPRKLRKNSSDICIHRVTPDSLQSLSDSQRHTANFHLVRWRQPHTANLWFAF